STSRAILETGGAAGAAGRARAVGGWVDGGVDVVGCSLDGRIFDGAGAATSRVVAAASSTCGVGVDREATGSMEGFTAGGTVGRSETASGAGASGFAGTAVAGAASMLSYRSSVSRISGIDTERHDGEWQCR